MKKLPKTIFNGKTKEFFDGVELVNLVVPVQTVDGPEDCGGGPIQLVGGLALVQNGYYLSFMVPALVSGQYRNYGAPNGTNTTVVLRWERLPDSPTAGAAGWMHGGKFLASRHEAITIAKKMAERLHAQ